MVRILGIAVAFGHHFPELTKSVVSINGFESINWSKPIEQTLSIFQRSSQGGLPTLLAIGSLKYRKNPPSPEESARLLVPLPSEKEKQAVQDRFAAYTDDVKFGYILGMIPYVDRPLILIRPQNDQLLPEEYLDRTRKYVRKVRVRYKVVPDAGHFAFLDQPEKVAEIIETFLPK